MTLDPTVTVIIIVVLAIIAISVFLSFFPIMLWISALASGVRVGIITLVAMRFRRVVPSRIVNPLIKATKAGLGLTINQLESHFLAGGNVDRVVNSLIAAQRANIELEFERAAAIDLAGRDVLQAVQMSVNPRVIETPIVAAVAKNGIEVKVKARVTVRANIDRLVGGAGEETIIARVGEGIVTTIGSSRVAQGSTRKSRTSSPAPCLAKGLTRERRSRSCPSISRTWTSARTSARNCKPSRPKPISGSPKRRRKNAAPWPSRRSRR